MPISVGVKLEAYCKSILHAHKYPHHQVFGILVGSADKSGDKVTVEDAFPLFHGSILAPMLEAATNMVKIVFFNKIDRRILPNKRIYDNWCLLCE